MIYSSINCQVGLHQRLLLKQLFSIFKDALLPLLEQLQVIDNLILPSSETASRQREAQSLRNSVFLIFQNNAHGDDPITPLIPVFKVVEDGLGR